LCFPSCLSRSLISYGRWDIMMAFPKMQFRLLLLAYCVFITATFLSASPAGKHLTWNDIEQMKERVGMETMSDRHYAMFVFCLLGTSGLAWLIGLVYLFLLWYQGLYFFAFGCCTRVMIMGTFYLQRRVSAGGWQLHGLTELIFELTIVAVGLFGPAKHLFQRGVVRAQA
jgi:hypothetical protein